MLASDERRSDMLIVAGIRVSPRFEWWPPTRSPSRTIDTYRSSHLWLAACAIGRARRELLRARDLRSLGGRGARKREAAALARAAESLALALENREVARCDRTKRIDALDLRWGRRRPF